MTRTTDLRSLVVQADPEHTRKSRWVVEYEFTAPGSRNLDEKTHRDGKRIFEGDYQARGPYAPQATPDEGMTWNGTPINWDGSTLTWDDD